ncbi:MAG: hypothetical protein E7462_01265 [Ruminococcaceae bacterium]|nr:hypothetical protein [Oscillospiraceae bacterium]
MGQRLKKYTLSILFIYISVFVALGSTSLDEQLKFPDRALQIFAIMLYLPFLLLILWKIASDLKCFRVTGFNILYYLFGAYYVLLTAYRFGTGAEVKEGFYYSVVLFGVLALYALITEQKLKLDHDMFRKNLLIIVSYFVAIKVIFTFIEGRLIGNPPVNNLYSTSLLVILLPFLIDTMRHGNTRRTKVSCVMLSLTVVMMLVCSSRAVVLLGLAVLAGLFLLYIKNWLVVKRVLVGVSAALVIVVVMTVLNVGVVRYSLVREFNSLSAVISLEDATATVPGEDRPLDPSDALEQINRSDTMRSDLMKTGLAEVWKNPIFGTGDLYYTYDLGYKTMEQTAHNFLIESIVCYGLVGTAMIALLLLAIFRQCGLFRKGSLKNWRVWLYIPMVTIYFFAFGMVQPSVFNTLVCPIFVVAVTYYGELLLPVQEREPKKLIRLLKSGKDS